MALEPRDTFGSLRDAVGRFIDESFVSPRALEMLMFGRSFPVDISETAQEYIVEAALPGMKPEDVRISALGDTMTIEATRREADTSEATKSFVRRERYEGEVKRIITLPTPIEADRVVATYEHGVLTVHIPKSEVDKPKQIPLRTAESVKEDVPTH